MPKTIKFADGLRVEIDGKTYDFIDKDGQPDDEWSWNRVWKFLHYDRTNADKDEYLRYLLVFGCLDLSLDFAGHNVTVSFIPTQRININF